MPDLRWQASSTGAQVLCGQSPVRSLVTGPAVGVEPETTVADATALMRRADVSCVVVSGGAGILTERDVARAVADESIADAPVARYATVNPLVVSGETSVVDAAALMLNQRVRHLVVESGGSVGIVSLRDMAAVLLQDATPHLWLASLRVAVESPAEIWLG